MAVKSDLDKESTGFRIHELFEGLPSASLCGIPMSTAHFLVSSALRQKMLANLSNSLCIARFKHRRHLGSNGAERFRRNLQLFADVGKLSHNLVVKRHAFGQFDALSGVICFRRSTFAIVVLGSDALFFRFALCRIAFCGRSLSIVLLLSLRFITLSFCDSSDTAFGSAIHRRRHFCSCSALSFFCHLFGLLHKHSKEFGICLCQSLSQSETNVSTTGKNGHSHRLDRGNRLVSPRKV
nr:MAG TPA_asm: hypothetical protein [Caudoviricetes sp.]